MADSLTDANTITLNALGASASATVNDTSQSVQVTAAALTIGQNTVDFSSNTEDSTIDGSTSNSWNTFDDITGGSGTDTLTASVTGVNLRPNMTAVENLVLTDTGGATINMVDVSGLTSITSQTSTNAPTINNLQSVGSFTLNNTTVGATLNHTAAATVGASDSATLNLEGVTGAGGSAIIYSATTNSIESLNIASTISANTINDLQTTGAGVSTLGITGDQNLTISTALDAEITAINAGDMTGVVTLTLGTGGTTATFGSAADQITLAAAADDLTLGGGADTVFAAAGGLTTLDTIAGGDGTDTISYTADEAVALTDFTNVTSVEVLTAAANVQITGNLGAAADAAGIRTLTLADGGDGDSVTIDAEFTSALRVNVDDGDNTVDASAHTGVLTATITEAIADAAADTHTLTGGTGTADELLVTADGTGIDNTSMTSITAFEKITIANDAATGTIVLDDLNIADGATLTIDARAITTAANAFTLDASDDNDGNLVVLGGAGVNTITGSASDLGDNITGGASDDIFNFGATQLTTLDTIAGGEGTDTISYTTDEAVALTDFTNVTSVEVLTAAANVQITGNLGAAADAAGIRTLTLADGGDGDSVTIDAEFTSALRVNVDDGDNTVDASAYTGVLTATITEAIADAAADTHTLTGGTGTADELLVTADGTGIDNTSMTSITAFEKITIANDAATGTIVLDDLNIADGATLTIDARAITTAANAFTLNASDDTNGNLVVLGGAGVNTITGSASDLGDNITGGASDDLFRFATANLTVLDTIAGGDGDDSIVLTDDATVVDADFTLVTNTEILTADADINMNATLGALAQAAGLATVNLTDTTGNDSVTVGAGFTSALTVDFDTDANNANSVVATAYTGTLTVTAADDELDTNASTITGGTGTSDALNVTLTAGNDTILLTNVTGIENINTVGALGNVSMTTVDGNVAAGASLTIDATSMDGDVLTVDASAEADGTVTILADGTGDHQITLGQGNDTYTSTSTAGEDVAATAGNNTISTGDGDDVITLGTGNDTVNAGDDDDSFRTATANLTAADSLNGGDGDDSIVLTDDATVVDADFTLVTNTEILTADAAINMNATLGALAQAAGLTTVNLTDTGGNDSVTVGAGFTSALTVDFDSDANNANSVVATAYTGTLTVTAADDELDTNASTITGGTGTSDALNVTLTAGNDTILLTNVTGIENINTVGALGNVSMTTVDGNVAAGASLTIDATSMDGDVLTVDASAETDGTVTILADGTGDHQITLGQGNDTYTSTSTAGEDVAATAGNNTISTGDGDDVITLGTGNDTVNAGDDDDSFRTATANLTANDSLNGGDGDDSIVLTDDASVIDSDFTLVTNTEILTANANINLAVTLGANAAAAGVNTVTLTDTGAANSLTLTAGFTNDVTVNISDDATAGDTVDASAYTGVLTVAVGTDFMDTNANTLTGGVGTSDVLTINANGTTPDMTNVSGFENVNSSGLAGDITITLVDGNIAAGASMTIDGTSLDDDVLTVDASAEADGTVTILADGTGDHQITLGQGNDTYTSTSTAGEDVTATAGDNTISTGAGADIVTSGSGVDTITGGAGANVLILNATHLATTSVDVITDFTSATWDIDIDLSDIGTLIDLTDSGDLAAADDLAFETITGAFDLGNTATADSVLIADLTGNIASTDALETALEFGGDLQLTTGGAITVGEKFLVAYDDGTDSYIAEVSVGVATPDNTAFGIGSLVAQNLVKLTGIADVTDLAAGDIDVIA